MRFDDLASRAGEAATEVGRQAGRPSLSQMLERQSRRRRMTALTSTGVLALVFLMGAQLVPGQEPLTPTASPDTTSTTLGTTTTTVTTTAPQSSALSREDCPVTIPGPDSFAPSSDVPELSPPGPEEAWFGTPDLWTFVGQGGAFWTDLPKSNDGALTQKTFWWSTDFVSISDPTPDVTFTASRLDGTSPFEAESVGFGGNPEQGVFLVVGFQIPEEGCWQFTGSYAGATVDYVVWVEGR